VPITQNCGGYLNPHTWNRGWTKLLHNEELYNSYSSWVGHVTCMDILFSLEKLMGGGYSGEGHILQMDPKK
jgi:hypothetical protein